MRVVLLHDVTRSVCQAGHDRVAATWCTLLAPAFAALGHALECPAAFAADRPEPVARLMNRLGLAPEPASWVRLYSDPALLAEVRALLEPIEADLVLGWELSPNMVRALVGRGVAVIDMGVAPLRFGPDLYLRMRASAPDLAARLSRLAVPVGTIATAARDLREALAPVSRAPQGAGAVLFVGQTDLDASLITGAAVASVATHGAALRDLVGSDATLLLKPHPHGEQHADIRRLHRWCPQARVVTDSVYALLCDPDIGTVATLSSSVADEAPWFGRQAVRFITPDNAPAVLAELSDFSIVSNRALSAGFWQALLAGGASPVAPGDDLFLRRLFSLHWGWPPLPPRPAPRPRLGQTVPLGHGAGAAMLGFGWHAPSGGEVRSRLPLATLVFERPSPHAATIKLACRAAPCGPADALPVDIALRPGMAGRAVMLWRRDGGSVVRVDLPPQRPDEPAMVELSLRLPEGEAAALCVTSLRVDAVV